MTDEIDSRRRCNRRIDPAYLNVMLNEACPERTKGEASQ